MIWCTGFDTDLGGIRLPVARDDGRPEQVRGVVRAAPGRYVVGLPFLHSFSCMLVAGVGRDFRSVADHVASSRSRPRTPEPAVSTPSG